MARPEQLKGTRFLLLLASLWLLATGCAITTHIPTNLSVHPTRHRNETISVGSFANRTGFASPYQIRFNVKLNRPVSEVVRDIVVSELVRDGYTIGASPYEISGTINSVVYGKHGTSISFTLSHSLGGKRLYERTFQKGLSWIGMNIWDVSGQLNHIRECVRKFVQDLSPRLAQVKKPARLPVPSPVTQPTAVTPHQSVEPIASGDRTGVYTHPVGRRWALIVGISEYKDSRISGLRYAARDAKAFHDWLVSPHGGRYAPPNVRLLLNEAATSAALRSSLFTWLKRALAEDMVVMYFAGHGSPDTPDSNQNLFLLTHGTNYDDIAATAFPMWDLSTALKRFVRARKVVVIADACHSAGVGQEFDVARRSGRGLKVNPVTSGFQCIAQLSDGVCVLSASDDKQFSQESHKWGDGHGVFTHFLLKGLSGEADYNHDNSITLGELIPFLSEQVRRETKNAQSPTVAGKFDPALTIAR